MVFSPKNQLGLLLQNDNIYQGVDQFLTALQEDSELLERGQGKLKSTIDFLAPLRSKYYYLSDIVREMVNKIKIDIDDDFHFLSKIPNGEIITFLLGSFYCMKFIKDGGHILGVIAEQDEMDCANKIIHANCTGFVIDTETGRIRYHRTATNLKWIEFLIKTLTFVYLAETTYKIVEPKKVVGTKREGKYRNDFHQEVVVVDASWSQWSIRTSGFDVSGHLRLQPCGQNRLERQLIFIAPFRKNGYVRKPKKELAGEKFSNSQI